ncbi:MAG: radical SAM protein [Muribaculaceae bacterium]|nr:radical SAM protein [Muribaculaceae bacterium]
MQTVLFHETIFGPIHSRRLGVSLGINLTPDDGKICSFDCLYCEAGFNAQGPGTTGFTPRGEVARMLQQKLEEMVSRGERLDVITFSGNGEPTLHPDFGAVVDDVMALRDRYFPDAKVSVLTNSTRLADPSVVEALKKVDNNILKLDSAIDSTVRVLDRPNAPGFTADKVIGQLSQFAGTGIIQTMMLRGEWEGRHIDNTTPAEVDALIEAYKAIAPREIMIYSIDRPTPARTLEKIPHDELLEIGRHISDATGIPVQVN